MAIGAFALTAASTYAATSSYIWVRQKRLIFGRTKNIRTLKEGPFAGLHEVKPLWLNVAPDVNLEGWVARPHNADANKVLVYFGGRNEHVGWAAGMASYLGPWTVYAFNYRGFGGSGGHPSEASAKSDALQILDEIRRIEGAAARAPVVMGRSLGTAIAISVASRRDVSQLVLLSPFDSVRALVRQRAALNAMRWVLNQNFDCLGDASRVRADSIVLLASKDQRVPHKNSTRLAASLINLRHMSTVPGSNHKTLPRHPETQARIAALLNRTSST
jgi:pimeloyl-ACP methyl ester carboxylesterase